MAAKALVGFSSRSGGLSELDEADDDVDADDEWEWTDEADEPQAVELDCDKFLLTNLVMNRAAASISSLMFQIVFG